MSIVVVYMVTTIFQIWFERSLHQTCIDSTIGVFLENECFKSFTWSNIDFEINLLDLMPPSTISSGLYYHKYCSIPQLKIPCSSTQKTQLEMLYRFQMH